MNKLLYITLFSVILTNVVFSQEMISTEKTEKILKKYFSKIHPSQYVNLVPFYDKDKWGYLDKNSKKKIIPAIFPNSIDARFFNPDIKLNFGGNECEIKNTGEIIVKSNNDFSEIYVTEISSNNNISRVKSSKNGFKGFTLAENGELLEYSDLYEYNKQGIPGWNIQIFKHKNKHYGVVRNLNGEYGIIDSLGIPMQGFEFNYYEILINRKTADTSDVWFFIKKDKNNKNYSLINTNGVIKCENEIFTYPLLSSTIFGLTTFDENNVSGIFDSYNMEWVLKPQTNIAIGHLYYSSNELLNTNDDEQRFKANIYYLITEKNKKYFVDLNGNKYIPK